MALDLPPGRPGKPVLRNGLSPVDDAWLLAIRHSCQTRAHERSAWANLIGPLRYKGVAHEEIRYRLGLTIDDYRRLRRWTDEAIDESIASHGETTFAQALCRHEIRQGVLIVRFAVLKRAGWNRERIRAKLELTHDGVDLASEWFRNAVADERRDRLDGR